MRYIVWLIVVSMVATCSSGRDVKQEPSVCISSPAHGDTFAPGDKFNLRIDTKGPIKRTMVVIGSPEMEPFSMVAGGSGINVEWTVPAEYIGTIHVVALAKTDTSELIDEINFEVSSKSSIVELFPGMRLFWLRPGEMVGIALYGTNEDDETRYLPYNLGATYAIRDTGVVRDLGDGYFESVSPGTTYVDFQLFDNSTTVTFFVESIPKR